MTGTDCGLFTHKSVPVIFESPCTCVIFRTVAEIIISLYSPKIVKKEILRTNSNTGIYCSSNKVGTAYVVQYIFENSTVNINALCNSCEDMPCCTSECILTFLYSILYSEVALSRKPFGIRHIHIYTFLLRMTDTMTSQNTDLSSWDTCIKPCWYVLYVLRCLR
jgi:hypothetical protein